MLLNIEVIYFPRLGPATVRLVGHMGVNSPLPLHVPRKYSKFYRLGKKSFLALDFFKNVGSFDFFEPSFYTIFLRELSNALSTFLLEANFMNESMIIGCF